MKRNHSKRYNKHSFAVLSTFIFLFCNVVLPGFESVRVVVAAEAPAPKQDALPPPAKSAPAVQQTPRQPATAPPAEIKATPPVPSQSLPPQAKPAGAEEGKGEPQQPLLPAAQQSPEVTTGTIPGAGKETELLQTFPKRATFPGQKASLTPGTGPVSFFFDDADIFEVVQTVFAEILKVNYIIDQRVKGKVSFRTVHPIPREEVMPIMEIILRMNGVGFVEDRGLYRIVPVTDIGKELVHNQVGKDPEKLQIELFTFNNISLKDSMADIESALGVAESVGKMRVLPVQRLNSFLVVAVNKEQMEFARKWFELLDTKFAGPKPKVHVYPLQNSKASHVASLLQSILSTGGGTVGSAPQAATTTAPTAPSTPGAAPKPSPTPQAAKPKTLASGGDGGVGMVSPDTKIFADEIANVLIVLATVSDYAVIEELLRRIDAMPRQVSIEMILARVDVTDDFEFGFAWSLVTDISLQMKPFTRDINLTGDVTGRPAGMVLTEKTAKDGFTFVATDPSGIVRAKLTAAVKDSRARILASPHVLVADNREARIQIGQQVPIATSQTASPISSGSTVTNTTTSTIQYKDIGIILKVKPQINDSGLVLLEINQEVSSLGENVIVAGSENITINKLEATTNMIAQSGETIIIGGLIREDVNKSKSGIPYLSDIPIIGNLFSNISNQTTRVEFVILVTPKVVRSLPEASRMTSDYVEKYKDFVTSEKGFGGVMKESLDKLKMTQPPDDSVPQQGK